MIINRKELLETAKKAGKAIHTPNIQPIRECLKIEVNNGVLSITGSSTEVTIRAYCDIDTNETFECVVNARIFTDVLGRMVSDTVDLNLKADPKSNDDKLTMLSIKGGKSKIDVLGFDVDSWAELPAFEPKVTLSIDNADFSACAHALAKNDATGPMMNCFHIEEMETGYRLTALDGFRISERFKEPSGAVKNDFIINGDFLKTALSIAGEDVVIETDDNKIRIRKEGIDIYGQMTNGVYFNTKAFEQTVGKTKLRVNREELLDIIRVSAIMDSTLVFQTDCKEKLTICSRRDIGTTDSDLSILETEGEVQSLRFGMDARFIADALDSIKDEEVILELTNNISPIFMRGNDYLETVLPKKICS